MPAYAGRQAFRGLIAYLCLKVFSSETVNFFLPFFLRLARTRRPFGVDILSRKPCLFFLLVREG